MDRRTETNDIEGRILQSTAITLLQNDIKIIIDLILSSFSSVIAIYLAGGYGRDEGAWCITDGEYKPYNDYDFILITSDSVDRNRLNHIRNQCAELTNVKWVDIDIYLVEKVRRLKPTQKNMDVIYGSKLIYGQDVLKGKAIRADQLGFRDIKEQYFTRLWTFFGTAELLEKEEISSEERLFVNYQLSKAVLASIDCILIKKGLYITSYKEKVKRVIEHAFFPEYDDLFMWALDQKLFPSENSESKDEMSSLYTRVVEAYKTMMGYSFGYRWFLYSKPTIYRIANLFNPFNTAYHIYALLMRRSIFAKRIIGIRVLQNEVFQKLNTNRECDSKWICVELRKIGFNPRMDCSRGQALNEIAIARNMI